MEDAIRNQLIYVLRNDMGQARAVLDSVRGGYRPERVGEGEFIAWHWTRVFPGLRDADEETREISSRFEKILPDINTHIITWNTFAEKPQIPEGVKERVIDDIENKLLPLLRETLEKLDPPAPPALSLEQLQREIQELRARVAKIECELEKRLPG